MSQGMTQRLVWHAAEERRASQQRRQPYTTATCAVEINFMKQRGARECNREKKERGESPHNSGGEVFGMDAMDE